MDTAEDAGGGAMLVNTDERVGTTVGAAADGVEVVSMIELAGGGAGTIVLLGNVNPELRTP